MLPDAFFSFCFLLCPSPPFLCEFLISFFFFCSLKTFSFFFFVFFYFIFFFFRILLSSGNLTAPLAPACFHAISLVAPPRPSDCRCRPALDSRGHY